MDDLVDGGLVIGEQCVDREAKTEELGVPRRYVGDPWRTFVG